MHRPEYDWEIIQERRPRGPADDARLELDEEIAADRATVDRILSRVQVQHGRRDTATLMDLDLARRCATSAHDMSEEDIDARRALVVATLIAVERGHVDPRLLLSL